MNEQIFDLWIMRNSKWSWQEGRGSITELKDHADLQNTNYRITKRIGKKADPSHPREWEFDYRRRTARAVGTQNASSPND